MRDLPILSVITLLLLLATIARADTVSVRAELSSETVYAGERVVLMVVIDGKRADAEPDVSSVTSFSLRSLGPPSVSSQTITNIINGRMTTETHETYRYQYSFSAPHEPGTYTIPPVSVAVGGERYMTSAVRFRVIKPRESSDYILVIDVDKRDPYLGEPIKATLTWYVGGQAQGPVRFAFSPQEAGFELLEIVEPALTRADLNQRRALEVNFAGRQTHARMQQERFEGRVLTAVRVEAILLPVRAGETVLTNASVSFEVPASRPRSRGVFDSFFETVCTERYTARAEALPITVRPLPLRGRPVDFTGLVGRYEIECFAEPMQASVGDPITFMIRITGTPPLGRVQPPDIGEDPRYIERFRISVDPPSVSVGRDAKTIVRTIRALSADVTEASSLELAYFDTSVGEYRVARSAPVPLRISGTREITAADAIGGGAGGFGALEDRQRGIAANVRHTKALSNMSTSLRERLSQPLWLTAMLLPMAAYFAAGTVVLVRRQRAKDPEGRRRKRALANARKVLRRATRAQPQEQTTLVSLAVRGYIADLLLLPERSNTTAECLRALQERGIDATAARELLRELDRRKFGGAATVDIDDAVIKAARLVTDLEKQFKGGGK